MDSVMSLPDNISCYTSTAYNSQTILPEKRRALYQQTLPRVKGGILAALNPYYIQNLDATDFIGSKHWFQADNYYKICRGENPYMKSFRDTHSYKRAETQKGYRYFLQNSNTLAWYLNFIAFGGYAVARFGAPPMFVLFMLILLFSPHQGWEAFWNAVQFCGGGAIIGYLTYRICNYIASILPDKKSEYFDRRTGMISFSSAFQKENINIPFAEFDPYLFVDSTPAFNNFLLYINRYRSKCFMRMGSGSIVDIYVLSVYLKEFMDTSKPLPDVPELEAFRDQDPVTAEHDKKIGRSPRYWRDMSLEELQAKVDEKRAKLRYLFGAKYVT